MCTKVVKIYMTCGCNEFMYTRRCQAAVRANKPCDAGTVQIEWRQVDGLCGGRVCVNNRA